MLSKQIFATILPVTGIVILCVLLSACKPEPLANDANRENKSEAFIPNSLWISEAEALYNKSQNTDSTYFLFSEVDTDDPNEIRMLFSREGKLISVERLTKTDQRQELFYENGKIAFLQLSDRRSNVAWLLAFANEKPYAAATRGSGRWTASNPDDISLDANLLAKIDREAKTFVKKEAARRYKDRFEGNADSHSAEFQSEGECLYVCNLRKGEKFEVNLSSPDPGIYFTLKPNNGSDMEHRSWTGTATESGDITLTVFTVNDEPGQKFTLSVKRINPRNQAFARAS